MWGYNEKLVVCNLEEGPPQNLNRLAPWPWTSSLQNCEKQISIVYKLPSLWNFVIAARTKTSLKNGFCDTLSPTLEGSWAWDPQHPRHKLRAPWPGYKERSGKKSSSFVGGGWHWSLTWCEGIQNLLGYHAARTSAIPNTAESLSLAETLLNSL